MHQEITVSEYEVHSKLYLLSIHNLRMAYHQRGKPVVDKNRDSAFDERRRRFIGAASVAVAATALLSSVAAKPASSPLPRPRLPGSTGTFRSPKQIDAGLLSV